MTCEQFRINIEAFLSGELNETVSEEMRAHAETCPACAHRLRATAALVASIKAVGIQPMPASVEAAIRERISKERVHSRWRGLGLGKPGWAVAAAAVVVLGVWGALLSRHPTVTAAAILARAEAKLEGISSYHIKYRSTWVNPPDHKAWSYDEQWYRKPSDVRSDITQSNAGPLRDIIRGDRRWLYSPGSGTAVLSPISQKELAFNAGGPFYSRSPQQMLREVGEGSQYLGREKVGKWNCEVIGREDRKAYIDRDTGFLVKSVHRLSEDTEMTMVATVLEVNKPVPDAVFAPNLPAGTVVYKDPGPGTYTFQLDAKGNMPDNIYLDTMDQIARRAAEHNARLKELYTPRSIPAGFKQVAAGTFGSKPDASGYISYLQGFSTAYIGYVNPKTGAILTILESADKISDADGREVSWDGTHGRIATHDAPFPYVELFWKQGNAYITMYASLITEKQAIAVATSMRVYVPGKARPGVEGLPSNAVVTSSTIIQVKPGTSTHEANLAVQVLRQRLQARGLKGVKVTRLRTGHLQVESQSTAGDTTWVYKVNKAREGLPFCEVSMAGLAADGIPVGQPDVAPPGERLRPKRDDSDQKGPPVQAEGTRNREYTIRKGTSPTEVDRAIAVLKKRLEAAGLEGVNVTSLPKNRLRVETRRIADEIEWTRKLDKAQEGLPFFCRDGNVIVIAKTTSPADLDRAIAVLRTRLEAAGLGDVEITELSENRLLVETQRSGDWIQSLVKFRNAQAGLPFYAEGNSSMEFVIDKRTTPREVDRAITTLKKSLETAGLEDVSITKLPGNRLRVETQTGPHGDKWLETVVNAREGLPFR